MTDQVTICNLALDSIGARSEIASLTEDSQAARKLSLHWAPAVDAILSAAHWNFARKQAALALLKDGTLSPPDSVPQPWLYEYAPPADSLLSRYIMPTFTSSPASLPGPVAALDASTPAVRFIVSSDVDTNGSPVNVILTNQPEALLVYTYRVTNPELFDGQFVVALAAYLGSRVAISLTGDKNMAKMAFDIADRTTREARASNGNEGITVNDVVPDWIRVRGYASDWAYPPGSMYWCAPTNLSFVS